MGKVFKREDTLIWVSAALAGVILMYFVNVTIPFGRIGISYNLPFGWNSAPINLIHDCTTEEYKDPNGNHCEANCDAKVRKSGFPFAHIRPNEQKDCYSDANSYAWAINLSIGAISGIVILAVLSRNENKK